MNPQQFNWMAIFFNVFFLIQTHFIKEKKQINGILEDHENYLVTCISGLNKQRNI